MSMLRFARPVIYPLCLLVGSLLTVVAGVLHPDLRGDGAAQLAAIAQCQAWRAIHFAFLFGFTLSLTGLVGLAGKHVGTAGAGAGLAGPLRGGLADAGVAGGVGLPGG